MRKIDLDVVPALEPERARALVGTEAKQRLGGNDVAVAGLASRDGVEVVGMDAAAVSYPGFEQDLRALM